MSINFKPVLRLVASALFAFAATSVSAAEAQHSVVIHYNSGQEEIIALADNPQLSYNGPHLVISSPSLNAERHMGDISHISIDQRDLSTATSVNESVIKFILTEDRVTCSGLDPDTLCSICDTNGAVVISATTDNTGIFTADISGLRTGIYIVYTSNNNTYKIIKK